MRLEPARDAHGRWLKSGNPGGRPSGPMVKRVRELARECTEEAILQLAGIMRDPAAQAMARVQAAKELLSRGWGVPSDEVVLDAVATGDEHAVIYFKFEAGESRDEIEGELSDHDRRALPPPAASTV